MHRARTSTVMRASSVPARSDSAAPEFVTPGELRPGRGGHGSASRRQVGQGRRRARFAGLAVAVVATGVALVGCQPVGGAASGSGALPAASASAPATPTRTADDIPPMRGTASGPATSSPIAATPGAAKPPAASPSTMAPQPTVRPTHAASPTTPAALVSASPASPAAPKSPPPATVAVKKGAAVWQYEAAAQALADSRVSWFYDWGLKPNSAIPPGVSFVPMIWGASSVTSSTLSQVKGYGNTLLTFNEPDLGGQANMTVEQALTATARPVSTTPLGNRTPPASPTEPPGLADDRRIGQNSGRRRERACQSQPVPVASAARGVTWSVERLVLRPRMCRKRGCLRMSARPGNCSTMSALGRGSAR